VQNISVSNMRFDFFVGLSLALLPRPCVHTSRRYRLIW